MLAADNVQLQNLQRYLLGSLIATLSNTVVPITSFIYPVSSGIPAGYKAR
jgi:hypothetical protein